jgi:hypothetical protein
MALDPSLRSDTILLTSEIVTRAIELAPSPDIPIELRVWTKREYARVEVVFDAPPGTPARAPNYHELLLDEISVSWEHEGSERVANIWFEIDANASAAARCPAG